MTCEVFHDLPGGLPDGLAGGVVVRFATAGLNLYRTANRSEQLYFHVAPALLLSTGLPPSSLGVSSAARGILRARLPRYLRWKLT